MTANTNACNTNASPAGSAAGTNPAGATARSTAALLRWLGAGAMALSALVYMLQGIDQVDLQLRNWVYLILMGLLCGGGVLSRLVMDDAKSARLLFALAAALVPVQFSQLGGMIFELLPPQLSPASAASGDISLRSTLVTAAATLALALPVAYAGFSVLTRQQAKTLSLLFILVNAALLFPARTALPGMAILIGLSAALLALEQNLFAARPAFRTLEGRAVRAMFALPFIIALTRAGFHIDTLTGYCALGGISGAMMILCSRYWLGNNPLRALAQLSGTTVVLASWAAYSVNILAWHQNVYQLTAAALPVSALLLAVGSQSPVLGRFYRLLACVTVAFTCYLLLNGEATVMAAAVSLLLAGALLVCGIRFRLREPTLTGALLALVSALSLAVFAVSDISTSNWIILAGLGLVFVLAASAIERFGRRLASMARDSWGEVNSWR